MYPRLLGVKAGKDFSDSGSTCDYLIMSIMLFLAIMLVETFSTDSKREALEYAGTEWHGKDAHFQVRGYGHAQICKEHQSGKKNPATV